MFIEVTSNIDGNKMAVQVSHISYFSKNGTDDLCICLNNPNVVLPIKESYEEVKELIGLAMLKTLGLGVPNMIWN